jgi:exopolysaccharide biosynthesis protein
MPSRRSFPVVPVAALAVVAIAAGFVVREPLQRALVLRAANAITGLDVRADAVTPDGAGYRLRTVRVATADGAVVVDAPTLRAAMSGTMLTVDVDRPRIAFAPERYRDADRARSHDAFARWNSGATGVLRVHDGTLVVSAGDAGASPLAFSRLGGVVHVTPNAATADVTLQLVDGATAYPVVGSTRPAADGTQHQGWRAAALPAAAFASLLPSDAPLRPRSGMLRDLDVDDGATLHASVRLDDVALALGTHALAHLHGTLVADARGLGTRGIAGTLDAVPFDAAGEVHDFDSHYRWLREGSNDLRALGSLTETVAAEPNLRYAHLEATAPGLAYAQYGMRGDDGPVAVTILSIDPHEPTLHFDTALAEDHLVSGGERTSALGVRTHAVAGVNGDYFDIGRTYLPEGMLVRGGKLLRGPTDRAALAIDKNNDVRFAEFHLRGTVRTPRGTMKLTEYNDWPPGYVDIITPDYGNTIPPAPGRTFVALRPLDATGERFRVTAVRPANAPLPAQFGIAIGPDVKTPPPRVGDELTIAYRFDPPLDGAVAAIGGGPILLRDGAWYEDPHPPAPDERDYRWPVIALTRQRDGRLYFVAVDGRHPERSIGMKRPEFAELLQRLGAVDAMALDSGGSVTLVSRAPGNANVTVRNVPSDNSAERWISDALFLYSSAPAPTIVPAGAAPTPVPEARPTP